MILVMPDPPEAIREYARQLDLPVREVVQSDLRTLNTVPAVPALLAVNSAGNVVKAWIGLLTQERELEVLRELK